MTELYSLPKIPGSYEIEPIHSYPVNSLITGADYNDELKLVALVGYDFNWNQYFYKISNFDLSNMDQSVIEKFKIPVGKAPSWGDYPSTLSNFLTDQPFLFGNASL